jgi:hypothetical protein
LAYTNVANFEEIEAPMPVTPPGGDAGPSDGPDIRMEQIRELLVGEIVRRSEARARSLETRIKELEEEFGRRIDTVAGRIEALGTELTAGRRSAFEELSQRVVELGERIRNFARS